MTVMIGLPKADVIAYFEIARVSLEQSGDLVGEQLDLSDEEIERLHEQINEFMKEAL